MKQVVPLGAREEPLIDELVQHCDDRQQRDVVPADDALVHPPRRSRPTEIPDGAHDTCLQVTQHLGKAIGGEPHRVLEAGLARSAL